MIFGRWGQPVEIVRPAVLRDIRKFDGRRPNGKDRAALRNGSYVIVREREGEIERLYHQCYLRATDGSREITAAIKKVTS
jgi:hypothetical protein